MTPIDWCIVVGLAVFLVFLGAMGFSYGGRELKPMGGYRVLATFNRIDGLAEGDEVRLGGIKIGLVERQVLEDDYRAVVTLRVDSHIKLPADTSAAIHTDGLFGAKFVTLNPGGEETFLKPDEQITFTQDAVLVDELLELIIAEGRSRKKRQKAE